MFLHSSTMMSNFLRVLSIFYACDTLNTSAYKNEVGTHSTFGLDVLKGPCWVKRTEYSRFCITKLWWVFSSKFSVFILTLETWNIFPCKIRSVYLALFALGMLLTGPFGVKRTKYSCFIIVALWRVFSAEFSLFSSD